MKTPAIITALVCMLTGACTATALEPALQAAPAPALPETDPTCRDPQALARVLRLEDIYTEQDGPEAAAELLESLGVDLLQKKGLSLVEATRISGECVEHLEHVNTGIYLFDTGVILDREDGAFIPYSKIDYPWHFITSDDEHPERVLHRFVKAVDLDYILVDYKDGASRFIGVWDRDGVSVVTPCQKGSHEEFIVYDDIIVSKSNISSIGFFPNHHQAPGGYMQVLLKSGDDHILLAFNWWYGGLPIEDRA